MPPREEQVHCRHGDADLLLNSKVLGGGHELGGQRDHLAATRLDQHRGQRGVETRHRAVGVPPRRTLVAMELLHWGYYTELLKYKLVPTPEKKDRLSEQFDGLFATATGYEDLDARIAKTRANKAELLRVLELPGLPLHNNDAELGARVQARVRDVSYQTRSEQGTKMKDTL